MKKFLVLANIVLILSLIGIITSFFYLRGEIKKSSKIYKKGEKENKNLRSSLSNYSIIEKKNMFSLTPEFLPFHEIPKTKENVNLELKGTVVGGKDFSFAVIEDKRTRSQNLYRIGDSVNGMKIVSINENKIILKSEKGIISLNLSKAKTPSSGAIRVVSRKEVEKVKRNINAFLSKVRISPYFKNGKMKGFRVNYIVGGSIVEKMGIKKGDIIRRINGEVIDSPSKIFELYRKFNNVNKLVVDVERGGKEEKLVYEVGG